MAEKKKTKEEQRADDRKTANAILKSAAINGVYVAAANNLSPSESPIKGGVPGAADFGEEGKKDTYNYGYLVTLAQQAADPEHGDKYFASLNAKMMLDAEQEEMAKKDGVRMNANYNSRNLFKSSVPFIWSAIQNVTVGDMIKLTGAKRYDDFKGADLDKYMGDYMQEENSRGYVLAEMYLQKVVKIGTHQSGLAAASDMGDLERMLSLESDAKKAKEAEEAAKKK